MEFEINKLLNELTLEEKASLCSGFDFWTTKPIKRAGVPSIMMSDGPHGLRKENDLDDNVGIKQSFPATSFPPAVNIASTWNPDLAGKVGDELAKQCLDQDVQIILGPGTNIKRSPLCGRDFEYFSEDPYLAGKMCVSYINNVQKHNVGTSLKHFACNSQEHLRMTINEIVDERALREIYLPAFEMAVKEAQPWTTMCSYNRLNGTYLSDNKKMLNDILREEWGYEGIVVSDWNATNNRVDGIRAGMDLEMPSSMGRTDKQIVKAVKNGSLSMEELDKVVGRLLTLIMRCHNARVKDYKCDYVHSHAVAREVASESIVLLKNNDNMLPISEDEDVAIIGALAKTGRYQGSGSSRINPYNLVNFTEYLDSIGKKYAYADGYRIDGGDTDAEPNENMSKKARAKHAEQMATFKAQDEALLAEAIEIAKSKKTVVIFAGLTDSYECEGYDRDHMNMPASHNKLIEEVSKVNDNVIVVLFGGSPVAMPWIDSVKALVNAYLPGEAGFEALYDILTGVVNPSGKLAETYPMREEDYIGAKYYSTGPKTVEHRESVFVGYRYYTTAKKKVLFPFGYGLSYTSFDYSNLVVSSDSINDTDTITVSVDVTNTGNVAGKEVVELFVRDVESTIFRPTRELKSFEKVSLEPNETRTVTFTLGKRAFAYYNTNINDWHVASGEFAIEICKGADDVVLSKSINVTSTVEADIPDFHETAPAYYNLDSVDDIATADFEAVYGDKMPANESPKRGEFDINATMGEMQCCLMGKIVKKVAPSIIKSQVPNADMTTMLMLQQGFEEMPMRGLNGVTTGLLDMEVIYGMLNWANKKRFKGLCNIVAGFIKSLNNIRIKNKQLSAKKKEYKLKKEQEKAQKKEKKSN